MGIIFRQVCSLLMLWALFGSSQSTHFVVSTLRKLDTSGAVVSSYWEGTARSLLSCFVACAGDDNCKTATFSSDQNTCSLFAVDPSDYDTNSAMISTSNTVHLKKVIPCKNGGIEQPSMDCVCVGGYVGPSCERVMQDCSEGFDSGYYDDQDDIFLINPIPSPAPFLVRCVMIEGGYTVVQTNKLPSINFNRTWQEYRNGFGKLNESHWLGLDKMHYLTSGRVQDAYFFMTVEGSNYSYVRRYTAFTIDTPAKAYLMDYSFSLNTGEYNDLGDSLYNLKGEKFTTWDVDNDQSTITTCALAYGAGFWFGNCALCNPNGIIDGVENGYSENEAHWTYDLGAYSVILSVEIRFQKSGP